MQPRMSPIEIHDTLSLALELHLQCSELSGPYEVASRNLRALHNTLEKVYEVLEISASREVAALEKAIGECRRVLNAIEHALEYQDRQPLTKNATNVKFTARIEVATKKLLKAYDELRKDTDEGNAIYDTPVSTYHSQSGSDQSCELDGATNTASSLRFFDFDYKTGMAPSSLESNSSGRVVPRVVPMAAEKTAIHPRLKDLTRLSPVAFDSWKLPFAFADPMSSDIETASYLILARETSNTSQTNAPATLAKQAQESVRISEDPQYHKDAPETSPDSTSKSDILISRDSKPKYRVVNADPYEGEEASSDSTSEDGGVSEDVHESRAPEIPERNSRRTLRRSSIGIAQKRMARVFSRDCDDDIDSAGEVTALMLKNSHAESSKSKKCPSPTSSGPIGDVDTELEALTIRTWNNGDLDQAGPYLEDLLIRRPRSVSPDMNRRIRHLLGVIASLKGLWEQALSHFVSVLNTPVLDAAHLNSGDCAAAIWMGDIYALSNRKAEALVAYSIVEQSLASLASDCTKDNGNLVSRIQAEQNLCQDGNDRLFFELQLDEKMQCDLAGADSILNPSIMSRDTSQKFLELIQWSPNTIHLAKPNQSRAMALSDMNQKSTDCQDLPKLQLSTQALTSSAPWPMLFDPLFASGNIACGLSLSSARDLLHLKDIPRTSGALSRSRMNCFTCQDLHWLIKTLRACMERLELKYTEIANTTGTWLVPQYSSTEALIASTNFISLSIFRLKFRSGYGVEICPGGIFSSRIINNLEKEKGGENGGHAHELKRIKKLIRNYLDAALRRQEALDEQNTVIPVMSINGVTSIHRGSSSKGKRPESGTLSSPASSSRSDSLLFM